MIWWVKKRFYATRWRTKAYFGVGLLVVMAVVPMLNVWFGKPEWGILWSPFPLLLGLVVGKSIAEASIQRQHERNRQDEGE